MTEVSPSYRADLIRAAMARQTPPETNESLAVKAELSPGTISAMRNGNPRVKTTSLRAVALVLGLTMEEIFREPEGTAKAAA